MRALWSCSFCWELAFPNTPSHTWATSSSPGRTGPGVLLSSTPGCGPALQLWHTEVVLLSNAIASNRTEVPDDVDAYNRCASNACMQYWHVLYSPKHFVEPKASAECFQRCGMCPGLSSCFARAVCCVAEDKRHRDTVTAHSQPVAQLTHTATPAVWPHTKNDGPV